MKIPDDVGNSEIAAAIDEWVRNERYRAILRRRLIDGVCFEPLAEEFSLSVSQVKNIVGKYGDRVLLRLNRAQDK